MKLIITRKYETFTVCFTLLENPSVDSLEKSMQRHRFESDLIFVFSVLSFFSEITNLAKCFLWLQCTEAPQPDHFLSKQYFWQRSKRRVLKPCDWYKSKQPNFSKTIELIILWIELNIWKGSKTFLGSSTLCNGLKKTIVKSKMHKNLFLCNELLDRYC